MNVLLSLAYDGTNYCGWQRQKNGISVQKKLEDVLDAVFFEPISVIGASRTDAGVHALDQKAAFILPRANKIPLDKLPLVINRELPADIAVNSAIEVPDSFHPRFDAIEKTYEYSIYNNRFPNPLLRNFAYHAPAPLDYELMQQAAAYFVGTHDFAAFCAAGGSAKTSVRTIYHAFVSKDGELLKLSIRGNAFLYNMVRIIAGTIVYAGQKKIKPSEIEGIILSKNRAEAGKTAPPHGLALIEIKYALDRVLL